MVLNFTKAKLVAERKNCEWCEFTNHICEKNPECDFKTLPVEKDAILQRMKLEFAVFDAARSIAASTKDDVEREGQLRVALDKIVGLNFMAKMLDNKFGMPASESFKYAGWEKPSLLERIKLVNELKKMRKVN
jgi:hypothetical protein